MGKEFNRDRFAELPIVGILRGFEVETVRLLVGAALAGGLRCIEVTMNSPSAVEAIAAAIEEGQCFGSHHQTQGRTRRSAEVNEGPQVRETVCSRITSREDEL